jgi:hypothetical protein
MDCTSHTLPTMPAIEIDTPHGPARAHLAVPQKAAGAVALGHGAGGGVGAKDIVARSGGRGRGRLRCGAR